MAHNFTSSVQILASLLILLVGTSQATPIMSNTIGVTECQDCLRPIYLNVVFGSSLVCKSLADVDNCLTSCRPSDPLRILVQLSDIYQSFKIHKCNGTADCPARLHECMADLTFYQANTPIASRFECQAQQISDAAVCMRNVGSCSYSDKIGFVIRTGMSHICDAPACYTHGIVWRTVEGSNCTSVTMSIAASLASTATLASAPGTAFNTAKCALDAGAAIKCLN